MAGAPKETPAVGRLALAWVHLAVLWAFAFAKPLFDVLADSPDFFVVRGNTAGDILLLAFGVTLVPPSVLLACELPFARVEPVRRLLHAVFVGVLATSLALQVLDDVVDAPAFLLLIGAVTLGAGSACLYALFPPARLVLTVLAPAPVVFVGMFLLTSPISKLVLPQGDSSTAAAVEGARVPVVVVVFDEFSGYSLMNRGGRLDAERYPNFASLANDATWFPNATTVTDGTTHAVPAVLTGDVPTGDVPPTVSEYPHNLFTVLSDRYGFNVNEPATDLCPERLCAKEIEEAAASRLGALFDDLTVVSLHLLLPKGLVDSLPAVDQTFGNFGDEGRDVAPDPQRAPQSGIPAGAFEDPPAQWRRVTARVKRSRKRPTLTFAHVLLPHHPWQSLPSGQEYPAAGPALPGTENDVWGNDPVLVRQAEQRYLLQLGYVDRLLGQLVKKLRQTGQYDRALIVVTSDHGIAFRPGLPRREITKETFPDIASVPLFLKTPGQRSGRRDERLARTVDILPSVADALGVRLREKTDGRSLLGSANDPSSLTISALDASNATVRAREFKKGRDARVRLAQDLFGAGRTGLFTSVTAARLIGVNTAELRPFTTADVRIRLDTPRLFTSVNPRASVIPAFVTGVITGNVEVGERFAVALNGRIAGVGSAYQAGSETRVGAIVPPSRLRQGANRVQIFRISTGSKAIRLAHVPRSDTTFDAELVERDGYEAVARPSGRPIRLVAGAVSGFLDSLETNGEAITVSGWAVDRGRRRVADQVLVFADGELVANGRPLASRSDVAKEFGSQLERSGFLLKGVTQPLQNRASPRIRVVAISGGRASELKAAEG